jgi:hypothetical protein
MRQASATSADRLAAVKCELAGEVLRSFGNLCLPSIGWSMLPAVFPGDTLVVERVSPEQVRLGDVVVTGRGGRLCAHRVISLGDDPANPLWITQGDAVHRPDWPVLANELLGRVNYLIRAGRLIEVPAKLNAIETWVARVVRHSEPAARALVYLHKIVQIPEANLPCQE